VGTRFRKAVARLGSLLRNATARYAGGVLILLAFGIVSVWTAQTHLQAGTPRILLQAFGEAALVSSVLAILVDPYLKRRLQDESGWGALFGYLNPRAPKELREAIQELAACKRYYTKADWSLYFAWQDREKAVLAITLEVTRTGYNIGPEPYKPNGRPWVLASTHGYQTEYLRYTLSCPGHITTLDVREAELRPYVVIQDDHSVYLEEGRLVRNRAIPPDVRFESINRARMYRHAAGYVPLHYENFFESLTFTLDGPALDDLYVRVQHPRQDKRNLPAEWKRLPSRGGSQMTHTFGRATPGQVTLVSWDLATDAVARGHNPLDPGDTSSA
jgi:hypothetical protein